MKKSVSMERRIKIYGGLLAILIVFLRQLIVPPEVSGCYMKHLQLHDNNYH